MIRALASLPAAVAASGGNAADLQKACGAPGSRTWLCETVFRITGSTGAASAADAASKPVRIVFILLVAALATWLVRRLVQRVGARLKAGPVLGPSGTARRAQRADTIAAVLRSVATIVIWAVAVITLLGAFGIALAPLIAGAGVVGVALGFGAQQVVRDFLAGTFMLLEDQFGVGDVIDVGVPAGTSSAYVSGTVESVSLRITRLRDVDGVVWHVPNGQITRVGNKGLHWSRSVLDVKVGADTTVAEASQLLEQVAHELRHEDGWQRRITAEPEVWGVEELTGDHTTIRLVVRTAPLEQWNVSRELRARVKAAFDDAGLTLASAQVITYRREPEHDEETQETDR